MQRSVNSPCLTTRVKVFSTPQRTKTFYESRRFETVWDGTELFLTKTKRIRVFFYFGGLINS